MSKKYPCLLAAVLLSAGVAQAAPRQQSGTAERLWVWNLGDQAAEVALDASGAAGVRVEAGETVEAPELLPASDPAVSQGAETLVIKASGDFDPGALEIDLRGKVSREKRRQGMQVRAVRPAWARQLLGMAGKGSWLTAGQSVKARVEAGPDGHARLAVGLEKDSAVTVTIKDEAGTVLRSFSASSPVPVRWRADLGSAAVRLELRVDRGRAVAGLPAGRGDGLRLITAASTLGDISFSQDINYSGSLYFYVDGGPPSTCGELNTYRNGSWLFASNYVCTDANGDTTMGPWTWANTPADQTDDPLFVRWPAPYNTTTNNIWHIWDKECAVTTLDSSTSGTPPTSYYGHATDTQWGAGFDFGGDCYSYFEDLTTGYLWNPSTGQYSSSGTAVPATESRVDRWYVTWSTSFPSPGAHISGHTYRWYTCCHDGGCGKCTGWTPSGWFPLEFTKP